MVHFLPSKVPVKSGTVTDGSRERKARIQAADFRTICSCQHHQTSWTRRATGSAARRLQVLKRCGGALLVGIPLVFGLDAIPITAMSYFEKTPDSVLSQPGIDSLEEITLNLRERRSVSVVRNERREKMIRDFFQSEVPYGGIIYVEARRYRLPPELVAAVVKSESDFRPELRSHKNALGLMQLIPSTGALMGAQDLMDPADNVRAGVKYLRYLHDRFGDDLPTVLAAYNAGEGNVRRFGGIPPFAETRTYLKKVVRSRDEYHRRVTSRLGQWTVLPTTSGLAAVSP